MFGNGTHRELSALSAVVKLLDTALTFGVWFALSGAFPAGS